MDHWGPGGLEDLGNLGESSSVVEDEAWVVVVAEVDRLGSPAVVVAAAGLGFVEVVAAVMVAAADNPLVAGVEALALALAGGTLDIAVDPGHTLVVAVAEASAVAAV